MTTPPVRIDLAIASPVVLAALAEALAERDVRVGTKASSWVEFSRTWDFTTGAVVVDAHLDDHVPLALKVRALRHEGTRVAVLGRDAAGPQARRAVLEGADQWFTPEDGLATTADALARWVRAPAEPPSPGTAEPRLTDREMQVLCLYTSRRGHPVGEIASVLGLSAETVRTHLRTGRSKYRALGHDVGSRALLTRVLVDEGLVEHPDVWRDMYRW